MASTQIAFVPETRVACARLQEGVLSGLSFAVKDVFAVRGHVSTAGHPDWARTHGPADSHAELVQQLLEAGADLLGVTILDELAYSLSGENPHYGSPQNPRAEGRLCGGSSCGSAAAVAASLCDFALGTDTAGSLRVPASFCGVYGLRPTHGALSTEGVVPLAPSFDTAGLLAREPHTLEVVSACLFGAERAQPIERLLIADDALLLCDAGVAELLLDLVEHAAKALGVAVVRTQIAKAGFTKLRETFRRLQAREVWRTHGAFIEQVRPRLSPAVAARFRAARELAASSEGAAEDEAARRGYSAELSRLLTPGTLLFVPPTPGAAPLRTATPGELENARARTLELTALASLAGVPQLVVPARELDGAPIGLSFLAAAHSDAWLSQLAVALERALRG